MPLRVAFLASECEPWAKTGGLADVVDALARALGAGAGGRRRRRRSTCSCRDTAVCPDPVTRRGARARGGSCACPIRGRRPVPERPRRSSMSRRTAIDCVSWTTRRPTTGPRSTVMARATMPDNAWRFGLYCRAAMEALRADGRPPWTCSISTIGRRDRRPCSGALRYADDPIIGGAAIVTTLHNLAYHGWTYNSGASPSSGSRRSAGRRSPREPRRHRPARRGDRGGRDRQHRLARVRGRGAHAGLRHGARWVAALARGPVHRDPQRAGHHGLGSTDRWRSRRAPTTAPTGPDRPRVGPTCSPRKRARINRRRPGDRG